MSEPKNPSLIQPESGLQTAADMGNSNLGVMKTPPAPARGNLAVGVSACEANSKKTPAPHSCQQRLKLGFYFDGTGNNLDADTPTYEHSNVARLYGSRIRDNDAAGIYSFYIPGIGTYFPEIGDLGGDDQSNAFGLHGEQRLEWALGKLRERQALTPNLVGIDIALFGFSRGATLARAFANRVQARCVPANSGRGWQLSGSTVAIDIYFMGLWDTVAAVGPPKSMNNQSPYALGISAVLKASYPPRARMESRDVRAIAYGEPGADPATTVFGAWADGHRSWGAEIGIPAVVSHGVHMIAGHEMRNTYPCDTVMHGHQRAAAFANGEFVYPGAHSDVGGGYRPGEGALAWKKGQQMSLITLRVMYERARAAGVPLRDLTDRQADSGFRLDFAVAIPSDPEENHAAAREYASTLRLWNRYMDHCGREPRSLGASFLAHMKVFYEYRFRAIRLQWAAQATGVLTDEERGFSAIDQQAASDEVELARLIAAEDKSERVQKARQRMAQARKRLDWLTQSRTDASTYPLASYHPATPAQVEAYLTRHRADVAARETEIKSARQELDAAAQAQALAEDPMRRLEARRSTLPSHGTIARNQRQYNERLFWDAFDLWKDFLKREESETKAKLEKASRHANSLRLEPSKGPVTENRNFFLEQETRRRAQHAERAASVRSAQADLDAIRSGNRSGSLPSSNPSFWASLRPHYQVLMKAWENEFLGNSGLADPDVIAFFDRHVHDSLSDFGMDASLPSDPRVVYIGGSDIERFALETYSDREHA